MLPFLLDDIVLEPLRNIPDSALCYFSLQVGEYIDLTYHNLLIDRGVVAFLNSDTSYLQITFSIFKQKEKCLLL